MTNYINTRGDDTATHETVQGWRTHGLDPGMKDALLPMRLKEAGYRTLHVGKGHLASREGFGSDPCDYGFDVNVGGNNSGAPSRYTPPYNEGSGNPMPRSEILESCGWDV